MKRVLAIIVAMLVIVGIVSVASAEADFEKLYYDIEESLEYMNKYAYSTGGVKMWKLERAVLTNEGEDIYFYFMMPEFSVAFEIKAVYSSEMERYIVSKHDLNELIDTIDIEVMEQKQKEW